MVLTLYYETLSSPSRAVIAFLELAKIPHEKKHISVLKGETKSAEYLKINPKGLVPAIDDDGFVVWEHEAILKYLAATRKGPNTEAYYPDDVKIRTFINQYYAFHHASVRPNIINYFFGVNGLLPAGTFNQEEARKKIEETLKNFDSIYLKDKKYITGDKISIADFSASNEILQVYLGSDIDFSKFPRVKAYLERCLENPVIGATNKPVKEFVQQLNAQKAAVKVVAQEKKVSTFGKIFGCFGGSKRSTKAPAS